MRLFSLLETQYNQFTQRVKSALSATLSKNGEAYGNNTIFGQFVNVLSAAIQNIMLYIEDALVEQNKYTAQRKKSIYGLAAQSGYQPSLGKAASVQLKLHYTSNNAPHLNTIIANHTPLTCTQNGLPYNIILPQESIVMSLEHDANIKYIQAVQGTFESQTYVSTGGKYYTQNFNFLGNLDTAYMDVYINNEKWTYTDSLYDMTPDGKQWTFKISPVSGIDIIFGNDVYGRSLKNGDIIRITYLLHDGENGNIDVNTETYFVFDDPLQDISGESVDGNTMFNVQLATKDSVISGSNSESIDQVREMIGLNSRSLVLASPDNYKNYISKFSFCGYNRTWSEPGSLIINSLIMKNYKMNLKNGLDYFKLQPEDFVLTDVQKQSILNNIENSGQQLAGVSYNIFDPEICKYAMYIYVKMKSDKYDRAYVRNKIRQLVGEFFSNINNDMFIPKSDIITLIKSNIPEIDGVTVYFLSERNEIAKKIQHYEDRIFKYDFITGTYIKKTETVYVPKGTDPHLGLDIHGNILLTNDDQFPVLMKWDSTGYASENNELTSITDPLIITFE